MEGHHGHVSADSESSGSATSCEGTSASLAATPSPPKKKAKCVRQRKSYSRKFKQSWQNEEQFRNCLKKSPRSTAAKDVAFGCICSVDVTCGKFKLVRHSNSQRHRKLSQQQTKLQSMTHFALANDPVDRSARKFELMMCAFLSEHYLPISLSESLLDLFKTLFSFIDSEGLKRVSLRKQRTSNIIRQVFGKNFSDKLCASLREILFSVI